jgi:hypothetical protein
MLSNDQKVTGCFGLGLSGMVWAINSYFSDPPGWLLGLVFAGALGLLLASFVFLKWGGHRPKPEYVDDLQDTIFIGDALTRQSASNLSEYRRNAKEWILQALRLLDQEINDEDKAMFSNMLPTIDNNCDETTCRTAVAYRVSKLRLIMGRYFKGENLK